MPETRPDGLSDVKDVGLPRLPSLNAERARAEPDASLTVEAGADEVEEEDA